MDPARGAVNSLLPKLKELLSSGNGKLPKSARKQAVFLHEELAGIQDAFVNVEDVRGGLLSGPIKEWLRQARPLSHAIEHLVDKFLARRMMAADPPAPDRHKLIRKIRFQVAIAKASRQFAKDVQSYRGSIRDLHIQLLIRMDPALGAIDSLLPKLQGLLDSSKLRKSLRKEVVFLQQKLTGIQCDFSEVEDEEWVTQARALSYGIEQIVDKSLARPLRAAHLPASDQHKLIGRIRLKLAIAKASGQFVKDIQSYKYRITELDIAAPSPTPSHANFPKVIHAPSPRHADFSNIAASSPSPRHTDFSNNAASSPTPTLTHANLSNIASSSPSLTHADLSNTTSSNPSPVQSIAMAANDQDGLVEDLVDHEVLVKKIIADVDTQQPMIASILGGASEDKIELLNQVYQKLNLRFECTAWVTVSEEPDIKNVLWNILCQISLQDDATFGSLTVKETIGEIKKALYNKRYFIVVEDLWDITALEIIRRALTENSKGSAILMTSHKVSVDRLPGVKIYRVGPLSENISRELSGAGDNCPLDLVGISEEISEECSGNAANLPAAEAKEDRPTMPDICLSEHHKSCLLYLNMFRGGYEISEDRLLSGWIAEGYIKEPDGEECLKRLRGQDLIEAVKTDADGRDIWCLSDKGHKLITTFSAEENSVTILKNREGQPLPQTVGRLAIQGHDVDLAQEQVSIVRSLIVSDVDLANSSNDENSGANVMPFLSRFKNVRVLELGACGSLQNDHLNGIKSLLLLKYLVIGGGITGIPKNIDSLVFLQTLDLRATRVEELPGTIVRARQLKCLRVNARTKMPRGIGKMVALQELGDMNISNAELLKELSDLTNLTILRIVIWTWDDGYKDALLDYLGSLSKNLKSLSIFTCCSLHIFGGLKAEDASKSLQKLEIRRSAFLSLPVWISSLDSLSSLSVEVYKLSQEIINILGEMKNLLALSLKSKQTPASCTKNSLDFGLQYLSSLKYARVEILCFNANIKMVEEAKKAIEKEIEEGRKQRSKDIKLDLDLLDEIEQMESKTQAEHDTVQENQQSSPSTSTPASKEILLSSPARFCDRCGSEFSSAEYQFCPGCGTRRLTVQKKFFLSKRRARPLCRRIKLSTNKPKKKPRGVEPPFTD